MATNTPDGRLRGLAGQIAGLSLESLINPVQGGTYNFESIRDLLKFILNFFADISSTDLNHVPQPVLDTMYNSSSAVFQELNSLKNFNFTRDNPNQNSNACIQNLQSQWREAYIYAAPHIALAKVSSSAIAQELQNLKATVTAVRESWDKASAEYKSNTAAIESQLAERLKEFENVITATREASGKAAVSRQASEFETEAQKCLVASRWWFGATILTVAASLFVVYSMFLKDLNNPSLHQAAQSAVTNSVEIAATNLASAAVNHAITIEALQQTVARILIVTLLYSIVVWVARNYFANRHNYTVNRHRRNAMQTFRAFVEGTKDEATQDFILRQAAACAFAPQQTGYLKDESLPTPAPTSQFIDIVKPGGN